MKKKIVSIALCVLLVLLSLPLSAMAEKATESEAAPQAAEQAVQKATEPAAQQVEETTAEEAMTEALPQNLEAVGDETDTTVTENGTTVESKAVDAAEAAVDAPETLALPTPSGMPPATPSTPVTKTENGFEYSEENGTVTVTAYVGDSDRVTVPAKLAGKDVSAVSLYSFNIKELTLENGIKSLSISSCPSLTRLTLPASIEGMVSVNNTSLENLDGFKNAVKITYLSIYGAPFSDISGLSRLEQMTDLILKNCPNLTDVSPLKGLKNLRNIHLADSEAVKAETKADLLWVGDMEINTYSPVQYVITKPTVFDSSSVPNEFLADEKLTIEAENTDIAAISRSGYGWNIKGLKAGKTKVSFKYDGKEVGESFNVNVTGLTEDPDQPIEGKVDNLPQLGTAAVPGGSEALALYDNGELWTVSGEKAEKVMDNVKKYVGMTTYVGASNYASRSGLSWTMIEDNNGTLWTREMKDEKTTLNERVKNVVKYVGVAAYGSDGIVNGYALDAGHTLWNMGGNNSNQDIYKDVKDFDALGFYQAAVGVAVLKQNGDLMVRVDPSSGIGDGKFALMETGVTSLEQDERFIKDDVLYGYSLDGAGKVTAVKLGEGVKAMYNGNNFAVKTEDDTTWYQGDATPRKILETPMTDFVSTGTNNGLLYYLRDKDDALYRWTTATEGLAEKVADKIIYLDTSCYITDKGELYSLNQDKAMDTNVKKIVRVSGLSDYYVLKNDNTVYRNGVAILTNVGDMTVDQIPGRSVSGVYMVRLDGTTWYSSAADDPTPYQKADNLGKIDVTGVKLNKAELTLTEGQEEALTAAVQPQNATYKTVAWSSSNEKVATVDENGKIKAVSGGSAVITAKSTDGGKTASCKVTVKKPAVRVESVAIEGPDKALNIGFTAQLTARVQPENADNQNVSWSTADTGIATVDQSGKVTAVAAGTTTVRVTTEDGGKTAERDIIVLAPKTEAEVPVTEIVDTPQAVPVANTTVTVSVPESVVEANPALEGATLVITSVKDSEADESAHVEALIKADAGLGEAYSLLQHLDFKFVDAGGKTIAFDGEGGNVKVEIQLTDVQRSQFEAFKLYYRNDDGSLAFIADMTPDADGKVIAELPHFSEYVLVGKAKTSQPPVVDPENPEQNQKPSQDPAQRPKDSGKTTVKNVGTGIVGDANTSAYLCTGLLVLSIAGAFAVRKRRKTEK